MSMDRVYRTNFADALESMFIGSRVARAGWRDTWIWIEGDRIVMRMPDKSVVPWIASDADILAGDWLMVSDNA